MDTGSRYVSIVTELIGEPLLMEYSNGETPKEKTKQILAIMPILPGDKNRDHGPERTKPADITKGQGASNLIDLSNNTAPQPVKVPAQPHDKTAPVAASIPKPVQRQDTDTISVEEFVDAKN